MKHSKRGLITILSIGFMLFNFVFGYSFVEALNNANKNSVYIDNTIPSEYHSDNIITEISDVIIEMGIRENIYKENVLREEEQMLFEREEEIRIAYEEKVRKEKLEEERLTKLKIQEEKLAREKKKEIEVATNRSLSNYRSEFINFKATAYDLSPQSQGKWGDQVASGKIRLSGHSRESARCIAVDPKIIPLGSIVEIIIPSMPEYSGEYIAYDTGGAIKGNRIDIFTGPDRQTAMNFGRREVQVRVIGKAW